MTMKRRCTRQFLAMFLGVFLALGMTLSAVQAGENAAQMLAMTDAAGTSGPGNCDGCGGEEEGTKAVTCGPVLTCAGMAAVLPVERGLALTHSGPAFIPLSVVVHSLIAPPDPYPPRLLDID